MKNIADSFRHYLYIIIVALNVLGTIFVPIDLNISNKLILIAGSVSLFVLLFYRNVNLNRSIFILAFGLFLLGSLDLIWYEYYKTDLVIYKNGYRGYLEAGKMLVFTSFSFLVIYSYRYSVNFKIHIITAVVTQIILLSRAYYQSIMLNADRIPLSAMNGNIGQMGAATIAAYVITFTALYSSIVFTLLQNRFKWVLFYTNFALSFAAITMTGTRAAIITYPLLTIIMVVICHREHKKSLAKGLIGTLILLIGCGLIFNKELGNRAAALKHDIDLYVMKNSSASSVGARFSMIQAGIISAPSGLKWQSLEQRAEKIKKLSKQNPIYKSATVFLDVHMHNEVSEAISTKGTLGVIFLLLFYAALIYYCVAEKQFLLLVFPVSIILFGLSDVITHAKPIPAAWITCMLLSVLMLRNNESKK